MKNCNLHTNLCSSLQVALLLTVAQRIPWSPQQLGRSDGCAMLEAAIESHAACGILNEELTLGPRSDVHSVGTLTIGAGPSLWF